MVIGSSLGFLSELLFFVSVVYWLISWIPAWVTVFGYYCVVADLSDSMWVTWEK